VVVVGLTTGQVPAPGNPGVVRDQGSLEYNGAFVLPTPPGDPWKAETVVGVFRKPLMNARIASITSVAADAKRIGHTRRSCGLVPSNPSIIHVIKLVTKSTPPTAEDAMGGILDFFPNIFSMALN